jgi:hypothetical protein
MSPSSVSGAAVSGHSLALASFIASSASYNINQSSSIDTSAAPPASKIVPARAAARRVRATLPRRATPAGVLATFAASLELAYHGPWLPLC